MSLWLFRGVALLGYSEQEVRFMTLRKLAALYEEYAVFHGLRSTAREEEDDADPDAI